MFPRKLKFNFFLTYICFVCGCSVGGFGAYDSTPKKPVYHTITKGESLLAISSKFLTTPDEILVLNGLQGDKYLRVGQKLLVAYQYADEDENFHKKDTGKDTVGGVRRASLRGETSAPLPSVQGELGYSDKPTIFTGGALHWPLIEASRIVSGFGPRRGTFHDGLDLASPSGTKVLAAHDGIVAYSGSDLGGYGNLLVVKGDDNLITVYAHNRSLDVSRGDKVKKGQKIAEVGETGKAEGPHLHFEVRAKDKRGRAIAVDPLPLLKPTDNKPRFRVNDSLEPLLAWLR